MPAGPLAPSALPIVEVFEPLREGEEHPAGAC